jgi:hypothetical protein
MSEEKSHQQASDAANPEEKMPGQFWGIDFFFIHEGRILPGFVE